MGGREDIEMFIQAYASNDGALVFTLAQQSNKYTCFVIH